MSCSSSTHIGVPPHLRHTKKDAKPSTETDRFSEENAQPSEEHALDDLGNKELKRQYLELFKDPGCRLGSKTVKLTVGPEQEVFMVDKVLICRTSTFFNSAFNGGFQERNDEMTLPKESPITVSLFLSRLYCRKISWFHGCSLTLLSSSKGDFLEYLKVYVAADKWCIPTLKKQTRHFIQAWSEYHGLCQEYLLPEAYKLAITDDLQRLLALEVAAFMYQSSEVTEMEMPDWLSEFLQTAPAIAPKIVLLQAALAKRIQRGIERRNVSKGA